MTLSEFKFWLKGFANAFVDGYPTKEQWDEIADMIYEIKDNLTPNDHVFPPKPKDKFWGKITEEKVNVQEWTKDPEINYYSDKL